MHILLNIAARIDKVNQYIGHKVAWLTLFMVVATFITVVQRYVFASNHIWENELIIYAHALVFLTISGYVLQIDGHIRVDILYERFSGRTRILCDMFGTVFFLMPVCVVTSYYAYDFIASSWTILEISREYDGLPVVYILKSFILFFTLSLILRGMSSIIQNVNILFYTIKTSEKHSSS